MRTGNTGGAKKIFFLKIHTNGPEHPPKRFGEFDKDSTFQYEDIKFSGIPLFYALMERRMGVTLFFSAQIFTTPWHRARGQSVQIWCIYLFWFKRYKRFTDFLEIFFFHFFNLQLDHEMGKSTCTPLPSSLSFMNLELVLKEWCYNAEIFTKYSPSLEKDLLEIILKNIHCTAF